MKTIVGLCLLVLLDGVRGCTTLVAGRAASVDGSVMATHSDDGESGADARAMPVPALDHEHGDVRNVYYDTEDYPRYIGYDRGPGYYPQNGQKPFPPIGSIPQVNHTYAFFEATYGIMNEHQVGIGESTCSGVFGASAVGHGGEALFSVDELSRLALERCKTARCAVQLMGDTAVQYGFYGAGSFEGTAESLMVIDPREAFIFHILPDDTGKSAIWVAQRVPDDSVGVVANMFVIRDVDLTHPDFLGGQNMYTVAQKHGWWKPSDGPLDFTAVFSDGEYAHKFYSGRRMWGAFRLLAPSQKLPSDYANLKYDRVYPTFIKPDEKLTVKSFFAVHRDHYQGTDFDLTKGIASGPFGNPDRWMTSTTMKGNWERPIGLYRTSHTHLVQARAWLPNEIGGLMWYGPHAATGTVFVPFACGMVNYAPAYNVGDPAWVQKDSAYWAFRWVFNIGHARYDKMFGVIQKEQAKLEEASLALVAKVDKLQSIEHATEAYIANAEAVLAAWWALPDTMISKYADGWIDDGDAANYPTWWLEAVGYQDGPPPPPKNNATSILGQSCALKECVAACEEEEAYKYCVEQCLRMC